MIGQLRVGVLGDLQRAGVDARIFEAYPKFAEVPGGLGLPDHHGQSLQGL